MPCIAFVDRIWCRGIVWKRISTNRYQILLVDTFKIIELKRCFVQSCPQHLLQLRLQFVKVCLSRLMPNPRLRHHDVCNFLSTLLLDSNVSLCAKVIGRQENGTLDIRLFNTDTGKCIYTDLTKRKFYKKVLI